MSANVEQAVEASFRGLIAEKPYRSITVKEICEGAFISRRTFYANFVDKRAVVAYLFRKDAITPVNRIADLLSGDELVQMAPLVLERLYQGVLDKADYYSALVKPMMWTDATFQRVVVRALKKSIAGAVLRVNPRTDENRLKLAAYYHAGAQALFMEKWIYEGYAVAPTVVGELQANLLVPSLAALMPRDSMDLLSAGRTRP